MFSTQHFIWLAICLVLIALSLFFLFKYKPSLKNFLSVNCVICVLALLTTIFSTIKIVPSADGTFFVPYLPTQYLPIHLCDIQIIFMFIVRFAEDGKLKDRLLGFMYPTTIIGAAFALALPSIFSTSIGVEQAFTAPLSYEFFIYHSMLIVTGIYIYACKKDTFNPSYYFSTQAILLSLSVISLYANSMFGTAIYKNGELQSVEYVTNFFFTYKTPIGLMLTQKWQWIIYLLILIALAFSTIALAYIPVFVKYFKERKNK